MKKTTWRTDLRRHYGLGPTTDVLSPKEIVDQGIHTISRSNRISRHHDGEEEATCSAFARASSLPAAATRATMGDALRSGAKVTMMTWMLIDGQSCQVGSFAYTSASLFVAVLRGFRVLLPTIAAHSSGCSSRTRPAGSEGLSDGEHSGPINSNRLAVSD